MTDDEYTKSMEEAIADVEQAIQRFISIKDNGEAQGMLTSAVVVYEAINMDCEEHACYVKNYITCGPSATPSSSVGLARMGHVMLEQDILPPEHG